MDINTVAMGARIRAARKERKLSSEVVAEKVDIAVESLWHIENGAKRPSLQTLCNIAEVLDVSLDYLVGRVPSSSLDFVETYCNSHDLTEAQTRTLMDICERLIPVIKEKMS